MSNLHDSLPEVHWPEEPLDLPGWLDAQASYYRHLHTSSGRWLADELGQLAAMARCLHATTADVYVDRLEAVERMAASEGRNGR